MIPDQKYFNNNNNKIINQIINKLASLTYVF